MCFLFSIENVLDLCEKTKDTEIVFVLFFGFFKSENAYRWRVVLSVEPNLQSWL